MTAERLAAVQEASDCEDLLTQIDGEIAAQQAADREAERAATVARLEDAAERRVALAERIDEKWAELMPLYKAHAAARAETHHLALALELSVASALALTRTTRQSALGHLSHVDPSFFYCAAPFRNLTFADMERQVTRSILPVFAAAADAEAGADIPPTPAARTAKRRCRPQEVTP